MLFLCYLLGGFVLLPYLARTALPDQIAKQTNRPVTIGGADFNPFNLTLTLHNGIVGPDLADPEDSVDPILSFGLLRIKFAAASLFKQGLFSRQTEIDHLFVHLVRRKDSSYNLSPLLPQFSAPAPGQPPTPFSLNNVSVSNSRLLFDDLPTGKTHTVEKITLALPALANVTHRVNQYIRPQFSAVINGSPLQLTGETEVTADGLTARLSLQLQKFDLAKNFAYLPPLLNCKVVKGEADLDLNLLFSTSNTGDTSLDLEGTGTGHDIWLQDDKGRELAQLPQLTLKGSIAPLSNTFHLQELHLEAPSFLIERTAPDNWAMARPQLSATTTGTVDRVLLSNGKLTLLDRAVPGGFSDTWEGVHLDLEFPSDKPDQPGKFAVNGVNINGNHLAGQGELNLQPLAINALLIADRLDLSRFSSYLSNRAGFTLKSGRADKTETRLTFKAGDKDKGFSLRFNNTASQLHDLVIIQNSIERVTVPKLTVRGGKMDFARKTVNFGEIQGKTGIFHLALDVPATTAKKPTVQQPWAFAMDRFTLGRAMVLIEQSGAKPSSLTVNDLNIQLQDIPQETTGLHLSLAGRMGASDSFKLDGTMTVAPFAANLNATADKVPLTAVTSLFGQGLRLQASDGLLSGKGTLSLPSCRFSGEAELSNFVGSGPNGAETIRWRQATAKDLTYSPRPFTIRAARLDIVHPVVAWHLQPDRHTELVRLLRPATTAPDQPTWDIKQLQISDGVAPINDNSVTPPFSAIVNKIQGEITNFSDHPDQQSRISLQGMIDDDAPIRFTGSTNLFHPDENSEFYSEVANFQISRLAPYLIPHLGYKLAAGKLAIQTTYRRQGTTVTGNNHLRVNNLDPGTKITNGRQLPLTIALLTDPEQHMTFDIPIRGSLSEKDFSFRSGMIRGLRNLLLKTAVTPAALLAGLNNNTPPATRLLCTVGKEEIPAQGRKELTDLGKILLQRPLLALTIAGYADTLIDRETLRKEQQHKLAALKAAEQQREAAKLSRDLATTYGHEEIKPPTTAPVPEPTRKKEAVVITDAQLLSLAKARARLVYDFLRDEAKIDPARLRLVTATAGTAITNSSAGPGNRVECSFAPLNKKEGRP